MIHLLDVNVLIALADQENVAHSAAKSFLKRTAGDGWATCPITENGFIRIVGNPVFPNSPGSAEKARAMLQQWRTQPGHQFWPDDLSLCEATGFPTLPEAKHLTDCYLLGLAVARGGKFATFDRRVDPSWVPGGAQALTVLDVENR